MEDILVSGGCLCGYIRYEYFGQLGPSSYCYCSDCRKETGSAFSVLIRLEEKHFKITTGNNIKSFMKAGGSGNQISRNFCPNCGSSIFSKPELHPGYIWVRAGTLDDPSLVDPVHQSWTDSKVKWSEIPKNLKSFKKSR